MPDGCAPRCLVFLSHAGRFQLNRSSVFPQSATWQEQAFDARDGALFMLIAVSGISAEMLRYIHDAAKASIEASAFQ